MSPRTYRPGDPEYFHATPPDSNAHEVTTAELVAALRTVKCCSPEAGVSECKTLSAIQRLLRRVDGDAPVEVGGVLVSLPLPIAQRILAALDHLADARVDTNYTAASGNARSLAAELRAVIGK